MLKIISIREKHKILFSAIQYKLVRLVNSVLVLFIKNFGTMRPFSYKILSLKIFVIF